MPVDFRPEGSKIDFRPEGGVQNLNSTASPELGARLWQAANYAPLAFRESTNQPPTLPTLVMKALGAPEPIGTPEDAETATDNWLRKQVTPFNMATMGVGGVALASPAVPSIVKMIISGLFARQGLKGTQEILGSQPERVPGQNILDIASPSQKFVDERATGLPPLSKDARTTGQQTDELLSLGVSELTGLGGSLGVAHPIYAKIPERGIFTKKPVELPQGPKQLPTYYEPRQIGEGTRFQVNPQGLIKDVYNIPEANRFQPSGILGPVQEPWLGPENRPILEEEKPANVLPEWYRNQIVGKDIRQKEEGRFSRDRLYMGINPEELKPAIRYVTGLLVGNPGQSHDEILEQHGVNPESKNHFDPDRGFAYNDPKTGKQVFLSRQEAEQATGIQGTARAGGLDSQDLPAAKLKDQNAVSKLRTDSISQTQTPGGLQKVGEEIREGAGTQGVAQKTVKIEDFYEEPKEDVPMTGLHNPVKVPPRELPADLSPELKERLKETVVRHPVYHATAKEFDRADPDIAAHLPGTGSRFGLHFGVHPEQAASRARGIITKGLNTAKYYLDIRNPARVTDEGANYGNATAEELLNSDIITIQEFNNLRYKGSGRLEDRIKELLLRKGYDGLVYKNMGESAGLGKYEDSYVAFDKSQIINAINPKKDFSRGGELYTGAAFKLTDQFIRDVLAKADPKDREYLQGIFNSNQDKKEFEQALGLNQLFGTGKMTDELFDTLYDIPFKIRKDAGDVVAAMRPKELQAAASAEIKKRFNEVDPKRTKAWEIFQKSRGNVTFYSGLPLGELRNLGDVGRQVKDAFERFKLGHMNEDTMARLLDAADNLAKSPEDRARTHREWLQQLSQLEMPDGKVLVSKGRETPPGFVPRTYMGARVNVNKDVMQMFDRLTSPSFVRQHVVGRVALRGEAEIKHKLLAFDLFHALRLARRAAFLTNKFPDMYLKSMLSEPGKSKGILSVLDYTSEEMKILKSKGLVDDDTLKLYNARKKDADFLLKSGVNVKRWAESIEVKRLFEGPLKIAGVDVNPFSYSSRFNHWVFDKVSRSAMLQVGFHILDKAREQHPEATEEQLEAYVAKQSNVYLANLGRQGLMKSQSAKDLSNIAFLAPSWVEGLIQSEARAARQAVDAVKGKGIGPQLKGIGTGVLAYFVGNQLINMATRGQPTWDNKEEGHKFDAWIPDWTGKTKGFWLSPLSDSAEMTHDLIKYGKRGDYSTPMKAAGSVVAAGARIAQNKLSPLSRAEEALRVGEDYSGRKLGPDERIKESAKALIPTPLPFAGVTSEVPGAVQRQLMTTLGARTEPASYSETIEGLTLEQRRKDAIDRKKHKSTAEYFEVKRGTDLINDLSKADRNWIQSRSLTLPGYQDNVSYRGTELKLSDKEAKRLRELMVSEYSRAMQEIRKDYDGALPDYRENLFDTDLKQARNRARQQFYGELLRSSSKNEFDKNRGVGVRGIRQPLDFRREK